MTIEDEIAAATRALGSVATVQSVRCCWRAVGSDVDCGAPALVGSDPARCRSHGGLAVVSIAAASVRLELAREKIVEKLSEAVELAVDVYVAVLRSDYWLQGSETTVQRIVGRGDNERVVEIEDGIKITTRDKLRAAELVLALAGANAETLSRPSSSDSVGLGGPEGALQAVLERMPSEAVERLARRLHAVTVQESA